jgi:hypothetical protein
MPINFHDLPKNLQAECRRLSGSKSIPTKTRDRSIETPFVPRTASRVVYEWDWKECQIHGFGWMAPEGVLCVFCDRDLDGERGNSGNETEI